VQERVPRFEDLELPTWESAFGSVRTEHSIW
jgi:hypothetical protein